MKALVWTAPRQTVLRVPLLIMGHEISGTIAALGDDAANVNPEFGVGNNVILNPLSCKGDSGLQARGLDQLCPTRQLLGAHRPRCLCRIRGRPCSICDPFAR